MSPTELPTREEPEKPGYLLTFAAALSGGTLVGTLGFFLGGFLYVGLTGSDGLDAIPPVVIGTALGAWAGPPLAVWLLLKAAHRRAAAPTGALLVAALPSWAIVSFPSMLWLVQAGTGAAFAKLLAVPIMLGPPALASRWLVLHNERVRAKREETSS